MDSPWEDTTIRTTNILEASLLMTCRDTSHQIRTINTPEASPTMTCRGITHQVKYLGINITRGISSKEDIPAETANMTSPKEDRVIGTSNPLATPGPETAMRVKTKEITNTMTQGVGPQADKGDPETGLLAEVVILPGRKIIATIIAIEMLTLAMGGINEETARRSCIMGSLL